MKYWSLLFCYLWCSVCLSNNMSNAVIQLVGSLESWGILYNVMNYLDIPHQITVLVCANERNGIILCLAWVIFCNFFHCYFLDSGESSFGKHPFCGWYLKKVWIFLTWRNGRDTDRIWYQQLLQEWLYEYWFGIFAKHWLLPTVFFTSRIRVANAVQFLFFPWRMC